jgi:hypothetical protein
MHMVVASAHAVTTMTRISPAVTVAQLRGWLRQRVGGMTLLRRRACGRRRPGRIMGKGTEPTATEPASCRPAGAEKGLAPTGFASYG